MKRPKITYKEKHYYGTLGDEKELSKLVRKAKETHILERGAYTNGTEFMRIEIVVKA